MLIKKNAYFKYLSTPHLQPTQAAIYLTLYRVIVSFPGLLLCVFCGSWSDRVGRKFPIIISCFLSIFGIVFFIGAEFIPLPDQSPAKIKESYNTRYITRNSTQNIDRSFNLDQLRLETQWTYSNATFVLLLLMGSLVRGFSGKSSLVTMAVHSYVSDVSDKNTRTERLGRLLSMNFFGSFIGSLSVGVLMQLCTFYVVFFIVIFLYFVSILLAHFFMINTVQDLPIEIPDECSVDTVNQSFEGLVGRFVIIVMFYKLIFF